MVFPDVVEVAELVDLDVDRINIDGVGDPLRDVCQVERRLQPEQVLVEVVDDDQLGQTLLEEVPLWLEDVLRRCLVGELPSGQSVSERELTVEESSLTAWMIRDTATSDGRSVSRSMTCAATVSFVHSVDL